MQFTYFDQSSNIQKAHLKRIINKQPNTLTNRDFNLKLLELLFEFDRRNSREEEKSISYLGNATSKNLINLNTLNMATFMK
jgi:hypothetical protein